MCNFEIDYEYNYAMIISIYLHITIRIFTVGLQQNVEKLDFEPIFINFSKGSHAPQLFEMLN